MFVMMRGGTLSEGPASAIAEGHGSSFGRGPALRGVRRFRFPASLKGRGKGNGPRVT